MKDLPNDILIIEDNPDDVRIVQLILKNSGILIRVAETLAQGLAALADPKINLVLLDLSLPDSAGTSTVERVRRQRPDVALVVLTGNDRTEVAIEALKSGADDFVIKDQLLRSGLEKTLALALKKKKIENERDLFYSASLDLICIISKDGFFKQINPACFALLGYTAEEICSRPVATFLEANHVEKTEKEFERLERGASVISFENCLVCKNGDEKEFSWQAVPVGDSYYAIARDISESRKIRLRLQMADRMASLGILAAGIAHEINNPLSYAITNLSLVMEDPEILDTCRNTPHWTKLTHALEGALRVRDVVKQLKIFSRGDDDAIEAVSIEQAVEAAVKMANHEISARARLRLRLAPGLTVSGNSGRLVQVLLNLLINAAHAIPDDKSTQNFIEVTSAPDGEDHCLIEVRDSGEGMSDAVKSQIFNPFFTTKAVGVGTGLGLSICHGIITSLGGSITVESKLGSGSCFKVRLKRSHQAAAAKAVVSREPIERPSRRLRVIAIDDDPIIAQAISNALSQWHTVSVCIGGQAGLDEVLRGNDCDVILCDLMMPEVSGIDVFNALNADGRGFQRKMVFITGGAFTPKAIGFMRDNTNPRLEKPFDVARLRQMISEFC